MNSNQQTPPVEWRDPIVEELHELRAQLLEKYQGDLHVYSEAARARALALGFQFTTIKPPKRETLRRCPTASQRLRESDGGFSNARLQDLTLALVRDLTLALVRAFVRGDAAARVALPKIRAALITTGI